MNFQPNCTDSEAGSDKISHRIEVLQMISNLGIACPLSTRFFRSIPNPLVQGADWLNARLCVAGPQKNT